MKKELLYILSVILFAIISCETTEPPPSNQKITLTALDASSTEAWLNLKQDNISLPTTIRLLQNATILSETNVNSNDTTLFIENLSPNQSFTFKVTNTKYQTSSDEVQVTTMDTTSHNFTWETFTFGGGGSSYFNDVAIINENDIWAVGEIHTEETDQFDSNGVWVQPYNAVHWDGKEWELKRILVEYLGQPNFAPLNSVFSLPSGEIIFSSGLPYLPENNEWKLYHLWDMGVLDNDDGSVNEIWGTSMENLYFAGNKGTIVHYNGSSWTKIESGTDKRISDVCGIINTKTQLEEVYVTIAGSERTISRITSNNTLEDVDWPFTYGIEAIWGKNEKLFYAVGEGIFRSNNSSWELEERMLAMDIDGEDYNSIVVVGLGGKLSYFNGSAWYLYTPMGNTNLSAVSIGNNTIAITATYSNKIIIGHRN